MARPRDITNNDDEVQITLRLPRILKDAAVVKARAEGVSLNTWMVRMLVKPSGLKLRPVTMVVGHELVDEKEDA